MKGDPRLYKFSEVLINPGKYTWANGKFHGYIETTIDHVGRVIITHQSEDLKPVIGHLYAEWFERKWIKYEEPVRHSMSDPSALHHAMVRLYEELESLKARLDSLESFNKPDYIFTLPKDYTITCGDYTCQTSE